MLKKDLNKFKLLSIFAIMLIVFFVIMLVFCIKVNMNNEIRIKRINEKLNYYELYDYIDTLKIVERVLIKMDEKLKGGLTNFNTIRISYYPYLPEKLKDFNFNNTCIRFIENPLLFGNLPDDCIKFLKFKLYSNNTGIIELIFGQKKVHAQIEKKNMKWNIVDITISE